MNRLSTAKRVQIVSALVEGCSIRSTVRMTGASKNTIVKLLANLGRACSAYHDAYVREVACKHIEADEIWSFVGMKEKVAKAKGIERPGGVGDAWTWVALDADSKLCVSWLVGHRDAGYAQAFMADVAERVKGRVQITTDGLELYRRAVGKAFGKEVDYAMLVKLYGEAPEPQKRYSPSRLVGTDKTRVVGNPDQSRVSTSYVERQNLTMRMSMRRFTRLTNGFSKKIENHEHAIALHFMHYNFCRIHQSLRVTPAMEAGVTDKLWSIEDLVELVDTNGRSGRSATL